MSVNRQNCDEFVFKNISSDTMIKKTGTNFEIEFTISNVFHIKMFDSFVCVFAMQFIGDFSCLLSETVSGYDDYVIVVVFFGVTKVRLNAFLQARCDNFFLFL